MVVTARLCGMPCTGDEKCKDCEPRHDAHNWHRTGLRAPTLNPVFEWHCHACDAFGSGTADGPITVFGSGPAYGTCLHRLEPS